MEIDYNSRVVVDIVAAMFELIENKGFTPDEVGLFLNKIKEENYEGLVEVYNNQKR